MVGITGEYAAALRALFSRLRAGGDGVGDAFAAVEALRPRVPLVDGRPANEFVEDALQIAALSHRTFEELALRLAHEGQLETALRLISLAEFLLPAEAGASMGVLWAQRGSHHEAARLLAAIAADGTRPVDARITALAALGEVDALDELVHCGTALLCELMRRRDYFFAALVTEVMALCIEERALTQQSAVAAAPATGLS